MFKSQIEVGQKDEMEDLGDEIQVNDDIFLTFFFEM